MELSELQAMAIIEDEDNRKTDPEGMSLSEKTAYLRGIADTNARNKGR